MIIFLKLLLQQMKNQKGNKMRLKPNVTEKNFEKEFEIVDANGQCFAQVICGWTEFTHHVPATFHHADESETESSGLNIEMFIGTSHGEIEMTFRNKHIPYEQYWSIVAHIDKYGHDTSVPNLVMKPFGLKMIIGADDE